jgi:hypothetical protein
MTVAEINDVYDQPAEAPLAPPSLSELVAAWEYAKANAEDSKANYNRAKTEYVAAQFCERTAYKAMNEAISATKPKRAKKKTTETAAV